MHKLACAGIVCSVTEVSPSIEETRTTFARDPMPFRTGIAGASGYTGAELMRLLEGHPHLELCWIGANRAAGDQVLDHAPGIHGATSATFEAIDPATLPELDLLFLAMPSGEAAGLLEVISDRVGAVVDLGADFRHRDPAIHAQWYGEGGVSASELENWVYGLTELARSEIKGATRVANPGCYPTAALLATLPLARSGLLAPGPVVVDGKSGLSGAGKGLAQHLHFAEAFGDFSPYAVSGHRHLPEIISGLEVFTGGRITPGSNPVTFVPHLVPTARGLLDTCYLPVLADVEQGDIDETYAGAYADEPFVKVVGAAPHTKAVQGSNLALVNVTLADGGGVAVASCAIDNLVKGAAGQAIQNANLMLGLDETLGLPKMAVWP